MDTCREVHKVLKIMLNSESKEAGSVGVEIRAVSSVGGKLYVSIGIETLLDSNDCILNKNKMLISPKHAF